MSGKFKKLKETMSCNSPRKSYKPEKKRMVKGCQDGKEKLIHYGSSDYGSNYSDEARKNFKARHNCDTATDKTTARYWACKNLWSKNSTKYSTKGKKGGNK
jgi:hypothetical protein